MSVPMSHISVCSGTGLNNRYEHTYDWPNAATRDAFFASKVVKSFDGYSYLRKSWSIKVTATMKEARTWDYLYFYNREGDSKFWYYFITNVEYISDTTVELFLELDVMQTYWDQYNLLPCFVEREHVKDDSIGANTVEEELDVGELVTLATVEPPFADVCVLVLATFNPLTTSESNTDTVLYAKLDGQFSGLGVYAVEASQWSAWGVKLAQLNEWGVDEGIVSMWMYPKTMIKLESNYSWGDGNVCKPVAGVFENDYLQWSRNTALENGYQPKNNKLLCYPYNMLYMTNNAGGAASYRWERFGDPSEVHFKLVGSITPEGSVKAYPLNYAGEQHGYEHGLSLGGFPTCAWNSDPYKLWLAQNQNQQSYSNLTNGLKIIGGLTMGLASGGLAAGAGFGMAASGAANIFSHLAERKDRDIQPAQAKGQHSASTNMSAGFQTFTFKKKCVTEEVAKSIDSYFTMYGYKVNQVKIPETYSRDTWNYVKTANCKITGGFCVEDAAKIESIYNNGVTLWHLADQLGRYDITNNIMG